MLAEMQSDRYLQLKQQLNIVSSLLPEINLSNTPQRPTDKDNLQCIAYKLLAHAEFESYFEDIGREIALKAIVAWKKDGRVSLTLLCLIAFQERMMEPPPPSLSPPQPNLAGKWKEKLYYQQKIQQAVDNYNTAVAKNHGIKEGNILNILLPVGLNPDKLDPLSLTNFSNFGQDRGKIAHSSTQLASMLNPADERSIVNSLLEAVEEIDRELQLIFSKI